MVAVKGMPTVALWVAAETTGAAAGVAETRIVTFVVAVFQFAEFEIEGVNVTLWEELPAGGCVSGKVQVKIPSSRAPPIPLAVPPVSVEFDKLWPRMRNDAVGGVAIKGVPLPMTNERVPLPGPS